MTRTNRPPTLLQVERPAWRARVGGVGRRCFLFRRHLPQTGAACVQTMGTWVVVEIASNGRGLPAGLIQSAYRASQAGLVGLVLNEVDPRAVNHILDPLVPLIPLTIPGVRYLKINDHACVREAVLSARMVFVATREFHTSVIGLGIDQSLVWPVSSALALLANVTTDPFSINSPRRSNNRRYPSLPLHAIRHPEIQRV